MFNWPIKKCHAEKNDNRMLMNNARDENSGIALLVFRFETFRDL